MPTLTGLTPLDTWGGVNSNVFTTKTLGRLTLGGGKEEDNNSIRPGGQERDRPRTAAHSCRPRLRAFPRGRRDAEIRLDLPRVAIVGEGRATAFSQAAKAVLGHPEQAIDEFTTILRYPSMIRTERTAPPQARRDLSPTAITSASREPLRDSQAVCHRAVRTRQHPRGSEGYGAGATHAPSLHRGAGRAPAPRP